MSLPRKHNIEQMNKLRSLTKGKDIGDIVKRDENLPEEKIPNTISIDNPFDRHIDTYENFIKKDNKIKMDEKAVYFPNREEYDELLVFLKNNGFDFHGEIDEFKNKWIDIMTSDIMLTDKALEIAKYLEDKWGLFGGFDETYNFMIDTFMKDIQVEKYNPKNKKRHMIKEQDTYEDKAFVIFDNYINSEYSENMETKEIDVIVDDIIDKFGKKYSKEEQDYMKEELYDIVDDYVVNKIGEFETEAEYESIYNKGKGVAGSDDLIVHGKKQTLTSILSPSILQIGKFVKVGELEGFIDSVDNDNVYIYEREGGKIHKVSFKDFIKKMKLDEKIDSKSGLPSEYWTVEENIYVDDTEMIQCSDCGTMIKNCYRSKIGHIFNKHFNKPEMDGGVPFRGTDLGADGRPATWNYGGKKIQELINQYFPEI